MPRKLRRASPLAAPPTGRRALRATPPRGTLRIPCARPAARRPPAAEGAARAKRRDRPRARRRRTRATAAGRTGRAPGGRRRRPLRATATRFRRAARRPARRTPPREPTPAPPGRTGPPAGRRGRAGTWAALHPAGRGRAGARGGRARNWRRARRTPRRRVAARAAGSPRAGHRPGGRGTSRSKCARARSRRARHLRPGTPPAPRDRPGAPPSPGRRTSPGPRPASRRLPRGQRPRLDCLGGAALLDQPLQLGDVVVPFDQRGHAPEAAHRGRVQVPHRIRDRRVVRVEQVRPAIRVPRQVELSDPIRRNGGEVLARIESVVPGADVDVVDVEEDAAVRPLSHLRDELPFREGGAAERNVAGYVLQQDLAPEGVLHLVDPPHDVVERFLGVRQRHQIVQVAAAVRAPAEVVGDVRGLDVVGERAQPGEMPAIERIDRADRQGDAVQHHREVAPRFLQHRQRPPADADEVLADRLDPPDLGPLVEEAPVVLGAEPDAVPEVRALEGHPASAGPAHRAPAPERRSLRGDDLAALGGAVLLGLHLGRALALAAVLALARVAGAVARALALALVHAGALDRVAGGLLLLLLGLGGARREQRAHCGGDHRAFQHLLDHRFLLRGWYCGSSLAQRGYVTAGAASGARDPPLDQVFARCQASRMPSRVTMPSGRGASGLSTTTASDVPDSESTCSACCRSSSGRSSTRPPVRASSPAVRAADPVSASRAARTGNTPTAKPRSSTTGTAARAPSSARSNSAPEDSAGTAGVASQAWATDRSRSGSSIRARTPRRRAPRV